MYATHEDYVDLSEQIARAAVHQVMERSPSLIRELALDSRDVMLERMRQELSAAIATEIPGWQQGEVVTDSQNFIREASQKVRTKYEDLLVALRRRAEEVTKGLDALQGEWRYLEHHSALQENQQRDILLHLSCSGQLEDRYELYELIDTGGKTEIWRARCRETGELRAIKRLSANSRSALLPRFLIEGHVGKHQLHHERLVRIYDYGGFFSPEHHKGEYYIACELLEGMTLHRWIESNPYQALSNATHISLVKQMVQSLQYLHKQGFIHCDVNPHNFFVTDSNEIKLLDFGIIESIRNIKALSPSQAICAAQSKGGEKFQAPEQLDSLFGKPTPKTDVYALGATLFAMFTEKRPFGTGYSGDSWSQFAPVPKRPRDLTVSMPRWLDALIVRCLEKDPALRPTLDELASVLEHLATFKIDEQRYEPIVEELSRVGFDPEQQLQEQITEVRSQFLQTLRPEETRFVPMDKLEQAEDHVVERVYGRLEKENHQSLYGSSSHHSWSEQAENYMVERGYGQPEKEVYQPPYSSHYRWSGGAEEPVVTRPYDRPEGEPGQIQRNHQLLQEKLRKIEPWDPLLQTCPNLLCQEDYQRGKQECPSCHTPWMLTCDQMCAPCSRIVDGVTNSYFTACCQDPACEVGFGRSVKIEAAYRATLEQALVQKRCAEAAVVLLVLGEHLARLGESGNFRKYYEKCVEELIPERADQQAEIFDSMRQEWRDLVDQARQRFTEEHTKACQSLLSEARQLCGEGRLRDALQTLQKFSAAEQQDQEVLNLRNELHEKLTAVELRDATQQLETVQKRLQQLEWKLDELTPVEDRHPGSNSISGWLSGVNDPLAAGEKGCESVVIPLNSAEELIQDSKKLVEQSEQPLKQVKRPIERSGEELQVVRASILELKDAFEKNQLKGVEGKLQHAQAVLDASQEVLGGTQNTLQSIQGDLDQARVKLGRSRGVLEETEQHFTSIQEALDDAGHHFQTLETSSKQARPQLEQVRQERAKLQEHLQALSTLLQNVPYPSKRQELLLYHVAEQGQCLERTGVTLQSREQQHEKLANEARALAQRMQKVQEQYQRERKRQETILQQSAQVQRQEEGLRKDLEQGQHQVRQEIEQIKQLSEARVDCWRQEQERRFRVLRTAISWGTVGALLGIASGLLLGWWLFARNITLAKPGWLDATLWGAVMGLVMTFSVTFALGRKVFQQPGLVVMAGAVAGGAISIVLHLMKFILVGPAVGVLFGALIGLAAGGGLGALWNVRKLEPWRTLEKAIQAAKFGALFGVFAGASVGSYIGYVRLLQANSFTWGLLTLGCVSLLAMLTATIGYFFAGGAWIDLKIASEAD